MATQSQQQQPVVSEAPGGEMLAGKAGGQSSMASTTHPQGEAEGVAMALGQGLHPHTLSKSQLKKQRKQAKYGQQQPFQSQPQGQPPAQHYKEKAAVGQQEYKKEVSPVTEGISKESAMEQQSTTYQTKEKPSQQQLQQPPEVSSSSLLSPTEKSRQWQARKEVERLEEKERQERMAQAQRQDLPGKARKEASLVAGAGIQGQQLSGQVNLQEEKQIQAQRAADSEASLIGTVIDEEQERQRRIEEDYPTVTEPLEKTKAMEEIERSRRLHSYAEKSRQHLAASSSAILFPKASHVFLPESKLWQPTGLLRREPGPSTLGAKAKSLYEPRYNQFIATTTKTTSSHLPYGVSAQTKGISSGMPVTEIVASSTQSPAKTTVLEMGSVVNYDQKVSGSKISKETYRSSSRPRLVVHHTGLSGKWQRHTETVELQEGIDF